MHTQAIAQRIKELNEANDYETIFSEFYTDETRSIEMEGGTNPEFEDITGLEAIQKKGQWWTENFTVHGLKVSEPLAADDWFALTFWMDAEHKESGERHAMNELAVYHIKDGKIAREQFFYTTG